MIRHIDHPRVRQAYACPMCRTPKPRGAVTCWPCHNECERGTLEQRTARESCLDKAEATMANPYTNDTWNSGHDTAHRANGFYSDSTVGGHD